MPATSLTAPLPACLSPAETRSTGCPGAAERRGELATVQAELTKLRPFCLERELESPWRLRWEGRRQLQLPKKKRLDKTFPAPGKEVNQPRALRRVLGHRLFLASLPATLEGAPGTQPVPSEPPNVARRLRWSGPRFRFQHQGQSTVPGPTSADCSPSQGSVSFLGGEQSLSPKD
uniref:Uncharacterized protein n=1 Tax=Myotis myotis TaxID=51298 RepID=A0A7J7ZYH4_MYOMY|nr:hypothetical protein mMyoMyo1_010001 [Myotis myotis]